MDGNELRLSVTTRYYPFITLYYAREAGGVSYEMP
jgi:hypothetical protein